MHPVLFELPFLHFPLRSFGVLVAAGFLLGIWIWGRLLRRFGEDPEHDPERASQVAVWVLIGVLGGARLMYVAVEAGQYLVTDVTPAMQEYLSAESRPRVADTLQGAKAAELAAAKRVEGGYDFLHDPIRILFIWKGGLVMYGGFFGAMLLGTWAARKRQLNPWNALDTGLAAGFVGQAVGRWGCLLVGDDYGSVVPPSWANSWMPIHLANGGAIGPLTIRVPDGAWLDANHESLFGPILKGGEVLWATQPWMSVNALLVSLVAYLVLKHRRWYGQVSVVVLIHYSITRFLIEMFRGDAVRGKWLGDFLSTSQLIAIPAVLFGIWLLIKNRGRNDFTAEVPAQG